MKHEAKALIDAEQKRVTFGAVIKNQRAKAMLRVNEVYFSIQGESTYTGLPCLFVRLTGCNLRCTWCDTEYGYYEGKERSIESLIEELTKLSPECKLVEITGGEPLSQSECSTLVETLLEKGYNVLIETSGSIDISTVSDQAVRIVDMKCPASGMVEKNDYENLNRLTKTDEVKFVIADKNDFDWSIKLIKEYNLCEKVTVLISPVFEKIGLQTLAELVIESKLPIRMQTQLHKYIWAPEQTGV